MSKPSRFNIALGILEKYNLAIADTMPMVPNSICFADRDGIHCLVIGYTENCEICSVSGDTFQPRHHGSVVPIEALRIIMRNSKEQLIATKINTSTYTECMRAMARHVEGHKVVEDVCTVLSTEVKLSWSRPKHGKITMSGRPVVIGDPEITWTHNGVVIPDEAARLILRGML